jgi:hypothetical protein
MSYCNGQLNGWFDDLLQAGEKIATTIVKGQSTPVGYGTYPTGTPPMFPPTYGAPMPAPAGFNLDAILPYLIIGGVVLFIVMQRKR